MFDIFAKLLSSVATFLFPVFASYKALKTSDPAHLTPWLIYWIVLACCLLVDSWVGWVLVWVPFYEWIKAGFLLYLILPQTQGARVIYQQYVDPFLRENELAIDDLIASAHDRAKNAGLSYLKQAIELVKQYAFGLPPKQPSPPPTPTTGWSYTQNLMARFNMPATRPHAPAAGACTGIDLNSLFATALSAATARGLSSPHDMARELSASGASLIPENLKGEDKMSFVNTQRERLLAVMTALDSEARNLGSSRPAPSTPLDGVNLSEPSSASRDLDDAPPLSKSRSEADFEKIEADDDEEDVVPSRPEHQARTGSWLPWAWKAPAEEQKDTQMGGVDEAGKSSGIEN